MYCINYVIQQGDTLYSISRRYGVSVNALMDANPLVNVYSLNVGTTLCIPVSMPSNNLRDFTTYLVEEGDTLGSLMERSGASLADLMQFNTLQEFYLEPGTTLRIPILEEGESGITL